MKPESAHQRTERHYLPAAAGSDGYYEPASDVHLYDLMSDSFASELDEVSAQSPDDVLVATGAFSVPHATVPAVENWLRQLGRLSQHWLTPWREGEPSITADLWLDLGPQLDASGPAYLVVRVDSPYPEGVTLRQCLNRAADRFDDTVTAVQREWNDDMSLAVAPATLSWLESMAPDDDAG
jgi:hypothetical protein